MAGFQKTSFNFAYLDQALDGDISSSISSSVDTNLKVNISSKKVLTVSGEILPKTRVLKSIFKELNISPSISYQYQLSY